MRRRLDLLLVEPSYYFTRTVGREAVYTRISDVTHLIYHHNTGQTLVHKAGYEPSILDFEWSPGR